MIEASWPVADLCHDRGRLVNTFGFVLHPLSAADVARKYPLAHRLPSSWVEALLNLISPKHVSHITGIRSETGAEIDGHFVGCPLTPNQLMTYPEERCYQRILATVKLAEDLGCQVVGLGAHTSVVGDAGITIAQRANVPITTGNSYTVGTAVTGALRAAERLGHDPAQAAAAVLGAGGSIGRACALLLADEVGQVRLCDQSPERLDAVAAEVGEAGGAQVSTHTDLGQALGEADIAIAVTSAIEAVVPAEALRPGSVVCDVARPRDVSRQVAEARPDVLVIEGGVVAVPGEVEFGFDFGFPPQTSYACMAETMILALEGRFESHSLGRQIEVEKVREITGLAEKHGFALAGFRSFERTVSDERIERVRQAAQAARQSAAAAS